MLRVLTLAAAVLCIGAASPPATSLRVGAAKIKITPTPAEMTAPFKRVADDIFVRAILIDNGRQRAVLVIADVPTIQQAVATDLIDRIAAAARVAPANVLLGTTHTHNAVRVDPNRVGLILPGSPQVVEKVIAATLAVVREAEANLQSARVGSGSGKAYLVANRNLLSPTQNRIVEGVDRSGKLPIDHGLHVIKFEDLSGKPIALLMNYAINPVVAMEMPDAISGDVPGAAARYVENRLGEKAVALFTTSAVGNPLYRANGEGSSTYGRAEPQVLLQAMGTILGEEALATAKGITAGADVHIAGVSQPLVCPGKITTPLNLSRNCAHTPGSTLPACVFKNADAPPVTLNMGVIRIGDVALVQADANVTPELGLKLTQASPLPKTWIVSLTYGPMRYVMDEASYKLNTYPATASQAKPGCAEKGFLSGALRMIRQTRVDRAVARP